MSISSISRQRAGQILTAFAIVFFTLEASAQTIVGDWSEPVRGLRGRLLLTPYQADDRAQLKIEIELEHVDRVANPIQFRWTSKDSMFDFSLADSSGIALTRLGLGGNEMSPLPYTVAVPGQSSLRIQITDAVFSYNADGRVMLRPTTFQGFDVSSLDMSELQIGVTFRAQGVGDNPNRRWSGPLEVPAVPLVE